MLSDVLNVQVCGAAIASFVPDEVVVRTRTLVVGGGVKTLVRFGWTRLVFANTGQTVQLRKQSDSCQTRAAVCPKRQRWQTRHQRATPLPNTDATPPTHPPRSRSYSPSVKLKGLELIREACWPCLSKPIRTRLSKHDVEPRLSRQLCVILRSSPPVCIECRALICLSSLASARI